MSLFFTFPIRINLKKSLVALCFLGTIGSFCLAVPSAQANQTEDDSNFTDKVKTLRVAEGEWDVFLEENPGPWALPEKTDETSPLLKLLKRAETSKQKLKIKVDLEKEVLLMAEEVKEEAKSEDKKQELPFGGEDLLQKSY